MKIELNDISVEIEGKEILKDISFSINDNELVMVLGLNGAGKTTLMKAIVGILKSSKGSITFDNIDITTLNTNKRSKLMAYVPQVSEIGVNYNVEEFILMGVTPHLGVFDMPNSSHKEEVKVAMEMLQISHIRNKTLETISGGERQLSYLARSMVQKSKLMVLDEPTAFLDFKRQHLFLKELKSFVKKTNILAILSVHDPNIALKYADKIILIHENTILDSVINTKGNEEYFINSLNRIYDNKLRLINCGDSFMVTWDEEA